MYLYIEKDKIPTDSATLIEEGLRRIQYFMKKNLTGDYTRILAKANTQSLNDLSID